MQVKFQTQWKAIALLLVITAMQLATVMRSLHHHESYCLLDANYDNNAEVLHAHAEENHACAWSGFHFSACIIEFPEPVYFIAQVSESSWSFLATQDPVSCSYLPSGRAPPSHIA